MANRNIIPDTPSTESYVNEAARGGIPDIDEPFGLLKDWLAEARQSEINDSNAMALATVDETGLPDVRMVLLKDLSPDGLTFYTHETSAKGQQLKHQPKAALLFHWKSLRRQIRIRGQVIQVPDSDADAYFASRARQSRLGAWASDQSQPLPNRTELKRKLEDAEEKFGPDGDIPRPKAWRGFKCVPQQIEFWQDQPFRLHDRLVLTRDGSSWSQTRLYP